nr:hypothetical protein [Tanacetum cinerariifolium]
EVGEVSDDVRNALGGRYGIDNEYVVAVGLEVLHADFAQLAGTAGYGHAAARGLWLVAHRSGRGAK